MVSAWHAIYISILSWDTILNSILMRSHATLAGTCRVQMEYYVARDGTLRSRVRDASFISVLCVGSSSRR